MFFNREILSFISGLLISLLNAASAALPTHLDSTLEGLQPIEGGFAKPLIEGSFLDNNEVVVNISGLGDVIGYRQKLTDYPPPIQPSNSTSRKNGSQATVEVYLGIPYAEPPAGEWRFKAPRAKRAWTKFLNATKYGAACPQPATYYDKLDFKESCLFLNIFTPSTNTTTPPYPVMVFIHGGEYTYGASDLYPGHMLAYTQKVVVVTFNYRLGALGFLAVTDNGVSQANYGLLDQRLALQWVRKYIENFHGDPSSVTLFGHGAGAACVGMHMLSPNSSDLFHKAIMQSGSELAPWAVIHNWQDALDNTALLASQLDCEESPSRRDSKRTLVQCMRSRRAVEQISKVVFQPTGSLYPWAPVVFATKDVNRSEYEFLPDEPRLLLERQLEKKKISMDANIPLMMGIVQKDGARFIKHSLLPKGSNRQMLRTDFVDAVRDIPPKLYSKYAAEGARDAEKQQNLIAEYYSPRVTHDEHMTLTALPLDVLADLYTDAYFVGPLNFELQLRALAWRWKASAIQHTEPVYQYVLNSDLQFQHRSRGYRTMSGDDIWLVLGFPFLAGCSNLTNVPYGLDDRPLNSQERDLSNVMMQMWANFARSSNPTSSVTGFDVEWKPYTIEKPSYLNITVASSMDDTARNYRHLSGNFWMHVLPQICMPDTMNDFVHRWQVSTWALTVVAGVLLLAFAGTAISYYVFRRNVHKGCIKATGVEPNDRI